jgi:flagellar biogenesis protein FliO
MGTPGADIPGYGSSIAWSFVSLAFVCLAAYVFVRWLARKGAGQVDACIRVIGRCQLEPRRSVCIIEAGARYFLIGMGDGPVQLLAELDKASLPPTSTAGSQRRSTFADVLARLMKGRGR